MCNFYIPQIFNIKIPHFSNSNKYLCQREKNQGKERIVLMLYAIVRDFRRIGREIAIYSQTDSRRDVWHRIASRAPRREIVYIIHADMWMCPPAAAADGRALFWRTVE